MLTENEIFLSVQENKQCTVCSRSYSPHCSLMSSNGRNFSPHPSSKILLNNNNLCIDTVNEKTLKHKKSEKKFIFIFSGFKLMLNGENIKIVRKQRREHNTIKFKNDFCNLRLKFKKYIE